ncbi:ABC transporter permease [Lentzea tibetensis]|uniref:ABC transporter permease n=1 Tax=Lentzea tibetensis TaxID=2591470 RepID=A0A563F2X6_9PSEU|nr:ABC transporter permease [Lentzea tibetensis]TWP54172.1 ABC transporter permease [Lentzea tibetensis]
MTAAVAPASLLRTAARTGRTRVGLVLVALVVLTALLGPLVAPHDPTDFVGVPFGRDSLFGADNLGRDVLSRFLHGGQLLLVLSIAATVVGVGVGTALGMVAGYRGGWRDELIMRIGDVVLAFPQVVLALLFVSIAGPKVWLLVTVVGLSHAPRVARIMRDATLMVVERDFVKAAEVTGTRRLRIMTGEILPNVTGPLMVELGLRLTYSIGLIAALSFLGLGLQPPTADWGLMINENRIALTVQPWAVVLPVVAIAVLTIGTNLVTDGLARASAGLGRGVER